MVSFGLNNFFNLFIVCYLSTYISLVLSGCIYNETFVQWDNPNHPTYSGFYLRDLSTIYGEICDACGCPAANANYSGTYMYILEDSDPAVYLYQVQTGAGYEQYIYISGAPCDAHLFRSDFDPRLFLDCIWSDVDTNGGITWRDSGDTALAGTTELCDTIESALCNTNTPTQIPTQSPIPTTANPTNYPTTREPTRSPTDPTNQPTSGPSHAPTAKPTNLPTRTQVGLDQPPCPALLVESLDQVPQFDGLATQYTKFNEEVGYFYNGRRVWNNGEGKLEIFFSTRYNPGNWIISNGDYHLIEVDGDLNQSLPGVPHAEFDHFPNDNPFEINDGHYTLKFTCETGTGNLTLYPTPDPTISPSSAPTPTTTYQPSAVPTLQPTPTCPALLMQPVRNGPIYDSDCPTSYNSIFSELDKNFARQANKFNNHYRWKSQFDPVYNIYYNSHLGSWAIDTYVGTYHGFLYKADEGMINPPNNVNWLFYHSSNIFTAPCYVNITLNCYILGTIPTRPPSPAPTTQAPTTLHPSNAPSVTPSISPSLVPSISPTQPPSMVPTGAPTLLCGGLTANVTSAMNDYTLFEGIYRREDTYRNNKYWWKSRDNAGTEIFYSDVIFHNSWVIHSKQLSSYWLLSYYDSVLHILQPPLIDKWVYYEANKIFPVDTTYINFTCSLTLVPTKAPTFSPSTTPTQPPSLTPSFSPTKIPSLAPSAIPSLAPSLIPSLAPTIAPTTPAPSNAPTSAPTREYCPYLQVYTIDNNPLISDYVGLYIRSTDYNGVSRYVHSNGQYLLFLDILTNNRNVTDTYWSIDTLLGNDVTKKLITLDNINNWRPPEYSNKWFFFATQKPTLSPTFAPSDSTPNPSPSPTYPPTNTPTVPPTPAPTDIPSTSPTNEPTVEPTFEPTNVPTGPTNNPSMEPTMEPTLEPTLEPTIEPVTRRRNLLQYGWMNDTFEIYMDCTHTTSPTLEPTTSSPTLQPTSSCEALTLDIIHDNNNTNYKFQYNGVYHQMNDYLINNVIWYLSADSETSIEYINGHWTVMKIDKDIFDSSNNNIHDEDPLLIYSSPTLPSPIIWLLTSPQYKSWYSIYDNMDINISLTCHTTISPTPSPTIIPTETPTSDTSPIWLECKQNWFTFVTEESEMSNDTYGVYWGKPIAQGEDEGLVSVDIVIDESNVLEVFNDSDIMQGDYLPLGVYTILYRVTNIYNTNITNPLSNDCLIKLYIIGNTYLNTNNYCWKEDFVVNIEYNETYQEIPNTNNDNNIEYIVSRYTNINGYATNPVLELNNDNCYVFAKQLFNATEFIETQPYTKSFLGIDMDTIAWEVLLFLLLLCVICLCCFRLFFYYRKWKKYRDDNDEQKESLLPHKAQSDANDDDIDLADIRPDAMGATAGGIPVATGAANNNNDNPLLQSFNVNNKPDDNLLSSAINDDEKDLIQSSAAASTGGNNGTRGGPNGAHNAPIDMALNALIGDAFDGDGVTKGGPAAQPPVPPNPPQPTIPPIPVIPPIPPQQQPVPPAIPPVIPPIPQQNENQPEPQPVPPAVPPVIPAIPPIPPSDNISPPAIPQQNDIEDDNDPDIQQPPPIPPPVPNDNDNAPDIQQPVPPPIPPDNDDNDNDNQFDDNDFEFDDDDDSEFEFHV